MMVFCPTHLLSNRSPSSLGAVVSDDDAASSEGAVAELSSSSSSLSLDLGLSIACGAELESGDSDDDDSDEGVVVDASVVAADDDGAVTVSVFITESFALYRLSPAKWLWMLYVPAVLGAV